LKQWWWDFLYPEETARSLPDHEDLYLLGQVTTKLKPEVQFAVAASLDKPIDKPDCHQAIAATLSRQKQLIKQAAMPKQNQGMQLSILACDQFIVSDKRSDDGDLFVVEGYPWYAESGRSAMLGLPGLTLSTRRYNDAKRILTNYSRRMVNGLLPNKLIEEKERAQEMRLEYGAADITLWWAWALFHYQKSARDDEFIKAQMPLLLDAARHYINGTTGGIKVDGRDGLLRCARAQHEFTWMDTRVAGIPITPRSGKPVEICALWYNFLETVLFLASAVAFEDPLLQELQPLSKLCAASMQKFWNEDKQCLYDVIEAGMGSQSQPVQAVRPNQIFAVSLPYRALTNQQEKFILRDIEAELVTPQGLRSLAPDDPGYQSIFGCGFAHADQYHRDLSYHNGMAWPWLLGAYCDAILNVFGADADTSSRIGLILQPLLAHLTDEACLGSISEIFDGSRPHLPRGAYASALAVAESTRWLNWHIRR
jgi:predicted glycogen debranching enzyme